MGSRIWVVPFSFSFGLKGKKEKKKKKNPQKTQQLWACIWSQKFIGKKQSFINHPVLSYAWHVKKKKKKKKISVYLCFKQTAA